MNPRSLPHPAARLLDEAGPTVSLAEAAKVLGISYNTASAAVRRDELGVRALRYGHGGASPPQTSDGSSASKTAQHEAPDTKRRRPHPPGSRAVSRWFGHGWAQDGPVPGR
jgi:hypothetical protein